MNDDSPRSAAIVGLWNKVPGSTEPQQEHGQDVSVLANVWRRLEQVLGALGNRWSVFPFVDFEPSASSPPAKSKWGDGTRQPSFKSERGHAPLVRETLQGNGLRPTPGEDWLIRWSGRMRDSLYQELHEYQRVNHFPGSGELTRKDRLWVQMNRAAQKLGAGDYNFLPETFVLPEQLEEFKTCYSERRGELWIVKPSASSQGRGIFLLRNLDALPLHQPSVVSRYISNPLLIQGLKFDLRIYVLVTSFDPLRAFIYREGLTRFASVPYSTKDEHLGDKFRHLTNYSINKGSQTFLENQELTQDNYGHKWSLSALNRHLQCVGIDSDLMWSRIMDIIVKTLLAAEPVISSKTQERTVHCQNCFELYGFDILVDEDIKPWLLEVNLSPSLQADSPLDKQVKSSVLCDALNLIGLRQVDYQSVVSSRLRTRLTWIQRANQNSLPASATPEEVAALRRCLSLQTSSGKPFLSDTRASEAQAEAEESRPGTVPHDAEQDSTSQVEGEAKASAQSTEPAEEPQPGRWKQVKLDGLSEQQLKMLAHALEEHGRCKNFLRLYPTKETVQHYAHLTARRSPQTAQNARILESVLFGPVPGRGYEATTFSEPVAGPTASEAIAGEAAEVPGAEEPLVVPAAEEVAPIVQERPAEVPEKKPRFSFPWEKPLPLPVEALASPAEVDDDTTPGPSEGEEAISPATNALPLSPPKLGPLRLVKGSMVRSAPLLGRRCVEPTRSHPWPCPRKLDLPLPPVIAPQRGQRAKAMESTKAKLPTYMKGGRGGFEIEL